MLKRKKILFISYYFPPAGGGGVQRALKFVKHLPSFGWEPVVLSASNSMVSQNDESLLQNLPPEVSVYRVRRFSLLPFVDKFRTNKKREYDKNGRPVLAKSKNRFFMPFTCIVNWFYDFSRYLANNILYIPDEHAGWLPGSVVKGIWLVKKHDLKMIFATGNPWTSFLTALILSKLTGVPFIIDFRDPWTLDPYFKSPGAVHKWLSGKFEKLCVHYAEKVLFTCDSCMKAYQKEYPNEQNKKFITITHGFELEDFRGIVPTEPEKFTISYIGTLYPRFKWGLDAFFEAVSNLLLKNPEIGNNLRINFAGIAHNCLEYYFEKHKIGEVVKIISYLDHRESLKRMMEASLLLIFDGNRAVQIPGKIFEYFASGKPILALVSDESDVASLMRNANAGMVVDPRNVKNVEAAILYFYQGKWKEKTSRSIAGFERRKLARCLAGIFDSVIS